MTARFIVGDTRAVTASLPDASVDLIMTSPPFLALRSYLPADHPDKALEIGSEAHPAEFIDMLLGLTAEWDRVLAPHGSICVELGDTYSGARGYGSPDPEYGDRSREKDDGWPLAKSKALIPELYRIGLAYGINPLTGHPSPAGRWRVRNVVTWCRPNPPVGALGDKFRPATSDLVIACRSDKRWFDLEAVRNAQPSPNTNSRIAAGATPRTDLPSRQRDGNWKSLPEVNDTAGSPPLDYWVIPPKGYAGSHYAVYPEELCRIPILSMCPLQVCRVCGEPRRRIISDVSYVGRGGSDANLHFGSERAAELANAWHSDGDRTAIRQAETLGWTDCGHDDWRGGVVYDPFAGSGTTLAVAVGCGRDAIGADLDERNADLAQERCGMFLTVEHLERAA